MLNSLTGVASHRGLGNRLLVVAALTVPGGAAQAQSIVTVTHPEVPVPTLIDLGETGESVGDMRLWHFDGEADDGGEVRIDWVMTTTGVDVPEKGLDSRISTGVFSVGTGTENQLILEGVAYYPGKGSTMEVSTSAVRVVVGGSGRFAGARGSVVSTHRDDGTWTHVFHLD